MVVTITVTLAVLLIPVIVAGSQRSMRVDCLNSQGRIGMALHGYANEHDGAFPPNRQQMPNLLAVSNTTDNSDIREDLLSYTQTSQVFYCSQSPHRAPAREQFLSYKRNGKEWYFQSYVMLAGLLPRPFGPDVLYEAPKGGKNPAALDCNVTPETVLLADFTAARPMLGVGTINLPEFGYHRNGEWLDGANLLLADGSVEWRNSRHLRSRLARRFRNGAGNTCYFFW